jgi:UDP-N-acetylmuramate dehydrogenase
MSTSTLLCGFEPLVQENVPLAPLTWYKLGGPARYLVRPQNPDQLQALSARFTAEGIRVLVLGLGANLLVADAGVNAAVFKLDAPWFKQFKADGCRLIAGAGSDMQAVGRYSVRQGLAGLECMAGIPGTVGGCIKGNAGGKFGEIGPSVLRATVMSAAGEIFDRTRDDLVFSYRKSNIAATFILEAVFDLDQDDPDKLVKKFKDIWIFKKNSQPLNTKNAGCIFKNPLPHTAGALIDQAGLKGTRIGHAEVSTKHANFIEAHPGCTAADVMALIEKIKEVVYTKHGVDLEEELVIWK